MSMQNCAENEDFYKGVNLSKNVVLAAEWMIKYEDVQMAFTKKQ